MEMSQEQPIAPFDAHASEERDQPMEDDAILVTRKQYMEMLIHESSRNYSEGGEKIGRMGDPRSVCSRATKSGCSCLRNVER